MNLLNARGINMPAKMLSSISIAIGVLAVICVAGFWFIDIDNSSVGMILLVLGFLFSLLGIIYSLVIRKICFEYSYIWQWIVGFVLNLFVFVLYVIAIGILTFIIICLGRAFAPFL